MKTKNYAILWRIAFISLLGPFILVMAGIMSCDLQLSGGSDIGNPDDDGGTVPAAVGGMDTFESEEELEKYLKDQYAGSVLPSEAYTFDTEQPSPVEIQPDPDQGESFIPAPECFNPEPFENCFEDIVQVDGDLDSSETIIVCCINTDQGVICTDIENPGDIIVVDVDAPPTFPGDDAYSGNDEGVDFSDTNIQEAGVDESDMVKTDGSYLYVAGDQAINIVDVRNPAAMQKASTLQVDGVVDSLYLYDNTLIVIFQDSNWQGIPYEIDVPGSGLIGMPYWIPVRSRTGVLLVDISDPAVPAIIKQNIIDGSLVSSRLISGKLHLVQQFLPDLPPIIIYYDGDESAKNSTIATNTQRLESITLENLLPSYETLNQTGETIAGGTLVTYDQIIHPEDPAGGSMVTVTTFNLEDPDLGFSSLGITADAHTVYASTTALYIAAAQWLPSPLSNGSGFTSRRRTDIHKFDLTGDQVVYAGGGAVPGNILNQFSLGEYDDVLRVATSTGVVWGNSPSSANHVYCLAEGEEGLERIGSLENLAPGERIYSSRFIGERGFMVTFVKVDPLFTIDLSDPTNPTLAGELKVPGYSDYIHLLDENHLLTIGKNAVLYQGTTWYQGLRLSIFDVSNLTNPTLLHVEEIGDRGSESEALHDHRAFTLWNHDDETIFALPLRILEHTNPPCFPNEYGKSSFNGLRVYKVDTTTGFETLGQIETSENQYWSNDWTRGVFIEDSVFAVEQWAVHGAPLENMDEVVIFPLN